MSGACNSACRMVLMKHMLPRFTMPRSPAGFPSKLPAFRACSSSSASEDAASSASSAVVRNCQAEMISREHRGTADMQDLGLF